MWGGREASGAFGLRMERAVGCSGCECMQGLLGTELMGYGKQLEEVRAVGVVVRCLDGGEAHPGQTRDGYGLGSQEQHLCEGGNARHDFMRCCAWCIGVLEGGDDVVVDWGWSGRRARGADLEILRWGDLELGLGARADVSAVEHDVASLARLASVVHLRQNLQQLALVLEEHACPDVVCSHRDPRLSSCGRLYGPGGASGRCQLNTAGSGGGKDGA